MTRYCGCLPDIGWGINSVDTLERNLKKRFHFAQSFSISVFLLWGTSSMAFFDSSYLRLVKMPFHIVSKAPRWSPALCRIIFFTIEAKIQNSSLVNFCLSQSHLLFLSLNFPGSLLLHFLAPHASAQMIYTYIHLEISSLWVELNWVLVQKWKLQELLWLPKLQLRLYDCTCHTIIYHKYSILKHFYFGML